ncbi:hypothetical protein ACFWBI_08990 [Streptomyces sp. NPDC059982]|uniref:hypothetical protein n=1 Tax=unclassified Streptomyces TaxID=2593676 RepID=UPI003681A75C
MSHLDDISAWVRAHIDTQGDTPIADAHRLILNTRDRSVARAERSGATAENRLIADEWNDAMLMLADAFRESGVPGWRKEWTRAHEDHIGGV